MLVTHDVYEGQKDTQANENVATHDGAQTSRRIKRINPVKIKKSPYLSCFSAGAVMSSPDVSGVSAYTVFAFTNCSGLSGILSIEAPIEYSQGLKHESEMCGLMKFTAWHRPPRLLRAC